MKHAALPGVAGTVIRLNKSQIYGILYLQRAFQMNLVVWGSTIFSSIKCFKWTYFLGPSAAFTVFETNLLKNLWSVLPLLDAVYLGTGHRTSWTIKSEAEQANTYNNQVHRKQRKKVLPRNRKCLPPYFSKLLFTLTRHLIYTWNPFSPIKIKPLKLNNDTIFNLWISV